MTSAPPTPVVDSAVEFPVEPVGTAADLEFLGAHASGATAGYVARRLGLATNTVNTYIARIRRKFIDAGFTAGSRVDLLRRAPAEGLLPTWS